MMAQESETASSSATLDHSSCGNPPEDASRRPQAPVFSGLSPLSNNEFPINPFIYPLLVPGLAPAQHEGQRNRGAGIYAVPVTSFMGQHVAGLPASNLIPLTYNIPTTRAVNEGAAGDEAHGETGQQHGQQQQHAAPRQAGRRFHIAFQLDLFLILKLVAVIFLFNQDGSRQRLAILVFFASLVYLYQTGALAPLVRWLTQGMQRAAAPAQPPRPHARADNLQAGGQRNGNVVLGEGRPGEGNQARPDDTHQAAENDENPVELGENHGNQWWGIVKEIQMIVFGFITSLLPGFQNID